MADSMYKLKHHRPSKLPLHSPVIIVLKKFEDPTTIAIFNKHQPKQTHDFVQALKAIDQKDSSALQQVLNQFVMFRSQWHASPKEISAREKEIIDTFFKSTSSHIHDLEVDYYTHHHTTALIKALDVFIKDNQNIRAATFIKEYRTDPSLSRNQATLLSSHYLLEIMQKQLEVADKLATSCQRIQSQIGSPDTTPRGLAIDFMKQLYVATSSCQDIFKARRTLNIKLLDFIQAEIEQLHERYPDIARAGEVLHNSYAKLSLKK